MPKRKLTVEPEWFYRRPGGASIFIRDRQGRSRAVSLAGQRPRLVGPGITTLAPIYGRVDFGNRVRFNGRTRSQTQLAIDYGRATNTLSSQWVNLPQTLQRSPRVKNQGMNTAMTVLTGQAYSATRYAIWYDGRNPGVGIDAASRWEWCHLIAHSMGGADNATNIVAARKGNNSEQLAIESALQMYRSENAFMMKVSAALVDGGDGVHLGSVIRYKVRCLYGGHDYVRYLDGLGAPAPSSIHFYGVLEEIALWANRKLVAISDAFNGPISAKDKGLARDAAG